VVGKHIKERRYRKKVDDLYTWRKPPKRKLKRERKRRQGYNGFKKSEKSQKKKASYLAANERGGRLTNPEENERGNPKKRVKLKQKGTFRGEQGKKKEKKKSFYGLAEASVESRNRGQTGQIGQR